MKNKQVRINGYVNDSVVDGPGLRFAIFMQGCPHACPGCHNPESWDMKGGYLIDMDELVSIWQDNFILQGITLSGGDPFMQPEQMLYLIKKAKETDLDVVIYTGFIYEDLLKRNNLIINEILSLSDYLIDGPFKIELLSSDTLFRGSSNQRIILLKDSLKQGKTITTEEI